MASTTLAQLPQVNGANVVLPEVLREAAFLEKVLQIRDEVLASKHPRIRLPPKILEQVAPRPTQHLTPPVSSRPATNGTSSGSQHAQQFTTRPESFLHHYHAASEYSSPASAQRPLSAKPSSSSSAIDPSLLTKSDTLIRAELQLKRQQIERSLKDQLDKKGRSNDAFIEEREARFDVEHVLVKAHELVKPESGLLSTANNSDGSESFDENSYYSSQANSWSSDEIDANRLADGINPSETLIAQEHRSTLDAPPRGKPTLSKPSGATIIDLDEEPYEPADDIEIYEPEPAKSPLEHEESDYSPPPAEVGPSEVSRGRQRDRANGGRNAVKGSSRRQSPSGNASQIQNPRKRRREERQERRRQQQVNKRIARSPEPYIKEEPQSPPPFASYTDTQPNKRRALQPVLNDAEIVSAADSRTQPIYYREQDQSPRSYRQYDEPASPTVPRIPQRRVERDDHDLRRVASLQYARRPYSPGVSEAQPMPEMRQIRAASHAFTDRPIEQVYREASVRPSGVPRYVRERSRSPVYEYSSRGQSPVLMAPPPRRIVVDQYGNKYYAAPVESRDSAAPPGRRVEMEPYFERAATREHTMRAPIRLETYEGDDGHRMPPPPRRYVEASEAEGMDSRHLRQREASHRPIDVEYPSRDGAERRSVMHYEEMAAPREYIPARAFSVRPELVRREVPSEFAPVRHESVQPRYVSVAAPRYREVSVVHQEPYDDLRQVYGPPSQARRYVEDPSSERPIELAQDPYSGEPRRVSYRY